MGRPQVRLLRIKGYKKKAKKGRPKKAPLEKKRAISKKEKKGRPKGKYFFQKKKSGNERKISKIMEFAIKKSTKQPFRKKKGCKKKKRKKGTQKKSPLEKKRAAKNKKTQGERPFFLTQKIGALDWIQPINDFEYSSFELLRG